MEKATFVHISDTHVLRNYEGSMMEAIGGMIKLSPDEAFAKAADLINKRYPDIDFVIITGDLVNEGGADDYRRFRELVERHYSHVPVYFCLGNHDRRPAFQEVFLPGARDGSPCDQVVTHSKTGLRIILLDSSEGNRSQATLDRSQLDWLRNVLAEKAEGGSILALHHPPYLDEDDPALLSQGVVNAGELYDVIKGSDIFAILSGHTHQVRSTVFGGIPHHTADALAFGLTTTPRYMVTSNRVGISYCTAERNRLTVIPVPLDYPLIEGKPMDIDALLKARKYHTP